MSKVVRAPTEQVLPPSPVGAQLLSGLVAVLVIGCVILAVGIIGWSIPRGIDVTDESFYLMGYRYPQEYEASFSTYHLLVARGLGLVDYSVLTYRGISLLVAVAGAGLFGWSFARWQRMVAPASRNPTVVTIGYVVLGSLLVFSIFPRTLSYNSLNSLFLLVVAAAVLQALRRGPSGSWWWLVTGVAIGLDVFVKPSTAFLLLGSATLLVLWCWKRYGVRVLGGALLLVGLGVAAGLTFYFVRVQPPLVWLNHLTEEMTVIQTSGGYGMKELLPSYMMAAARTVKFMVYPMGPGLLLIGLAWWWPRRVRPTSTGELIALALVALVGIYIVWQAVRYQWYTNAFLNDYQSLPLLLTFVVLAAGMWLVLPAAGANSSPGRTSAAVLPVGAWLFALPFLASAGTINDLRLNLLIDAAPWFALLLLLTSLYARRLPLWVGSALILLSAGWAAEQVAWGILITPYGLQQPMRQQVVPLQTAGLPTPLLVDATTASFFTQFTHLLAQGGFRPGDPIMAFYDAPGLVYVSGGISPGMPWYFSNRDVRNCHALDVAQVSLGKAYIVTTLPLGKDVLACLRAKGVQFPEAYRLVGTMANPFPVNGPGANRLVSVYAPR